MSSVVAMSSFSVPTARCTEFRDPQPFPMSWYVGEYVSYTYSRRFATMRESGVALTIRDRNNFTRAIFVGACVKKWLH